MALIRAGEQASDTGLTRRFGGIAIEPIHAGDYCRVMNDGHVRRVHDGEDVLATANGVAAHDADEGERVDAVVASEGAAVMPEGDTMSVVNDGRTKRGRCLLCGSDRYNGRHCPDCGYLASADAGDNPEWLMPGDAGSRDVLSDYGYPFDRFDDSEDV